MPIIPPDYSRPYAGHFWWEPSRTSMPLAQFFNEGHGRRRGGKHLYFVRYGEEVVYIGLTTIGVANRLHNHRKNKSRLGRAIDAAMPLLYGWSIEVVEVEGDLEKAEAYYIRRIAPLLNVSETRRKVPQAQRNTSALSRFARAVNTNVLRRRKPDD